jgi:hypothetical protein
MLGDVVVNVLVVRNMLLLYRGTVRRADLRNDDIMYKHGPYKDSEGLKRNEGGVSGTSQQKMVVQ